MNDADIVARVRLYATSEDGRQGPTPFGYFGCLFVVGTASFDCRLLLSDAGPLHPGSISEVPIKFLEPKLIEDLLKVGSRFFLRDGKIIGEGEVTALLLD